MRFQENSVKAKPHPNLLDWCIGQEGCCCVATANPSTSVLQWAKKGANHGVNSNGAPRAIAFWDPIEPLCGSYKESRKIRFQGLWGCAGSF